MIKDIPVLKEAAIDLNEGQDFYDRIGYVVAVLPMRRDPLWIEKNYGKEAINRIQADSKNRRAFIKLSEIASEP